MAKRTRNNTDTSTSKDEKSLAFQLTSGKAYNPDEIYLDASDAKGHYETITVKLPPRLQHVIEILVADNDGLRSRQDFIRNALFHAAHKMATEQMIVDPLAMQLVQAEANRSRTEMMKRIREEQNTDFDQAREIFDAMIEDRDWWAVNEQLDRIALLSEDYDIPEGVRDRYNSLWMEMNDALTREKTREIRRNQKLAKEDARR